VRTGRPIRELVLESGLLERGQLDEILSARAMTQPGIVGDKRRP
jgi:aspartate ammonia-lyase